MLNVEGMAAVVRRRAVRDWLLYGSLPVAAVAAGMVLGTYALLDVTVDGALLLVACCGAFLVYQAERVLLGGPEDRHNHAHRLAWIRRHRSYIAASTGVAVVAGVLTLPALQPVTLVAGLGLAVLGLLYALPLGSSGRRLKEVWYLKPVLISAAWAAGVVLLPVLQAGTPVTGGVLALGAYRFGCVLPNALLADWPDRDGDARAGLQTPATMVSEGQLRALAAGVLVLVLTGSLLAFATQHAPRLLVVDLVGPALMLAVVLRGLPQSRSFYGITLDLLVAWPLVTALTYFGF